MVLYLLEVLAAAAEKASSAPGSSLNPVSS
jgi:hypothetical protein